MLQSLRSRRTTKAAPSNQALSVSAPTAAVDAAVEAAVDAAAPTGVEQPPLDDLRELSLEETLEAQARHLQAEFDADGDDIDIDEIEAMFVHMYTPPVAAASVEAAPVEPAPVEAAPVEAAPVEAAPVEAAPVEPAPVEPAPILNVNLHASGIAKAPMSPEEEHIKRWFNEAFMRVDLHMHEGEATEWLQGDMEGHRVVLSQKRMREIGIVMEDGSLPLAQDPAELYWIQDKPVGYKDKYGVWDPVGAQWRIFTERNLVPIEKRIAPLGKGYGGTPGGRAHTEADDFTLEDYANLPNAYTQTALEQGLPHILSQIKALGADVELSTGSGWAIDMEREIAYYTPHLRHVQIDASVGEAVGKKYVYGFFTDVPVKPVDSQATWDMTNSVWIYAADESALVDAPLGQGACSERERDERMRMQQ